MDGNRLLVVQKYQEGEWRNHSDHSDDESAYEVCGRIEQERRFWRIIEYPNGRGNYPISLYDELRQVIGGREYSAGQYEAEQRVKRGGKS